MCGLPLGSHGDVMRGYGQPTSKPVVFGDVISLECGHRIHRVCMTHWVNVSPAATCPMCRGVTEFAPTLEEQTYLKHVLGKGWIILTPWEKRVILWSWIAAAVVSVSDPMGFAVVSSLVTLLTPPFLWGHTLVMLHAARDMSVSGPPGARICIAVTFACAMTSVVLLMHSTRDEYDMVPSAYA